MVPIGQVAPSHFPPLAITHTLAIKPRFGTPTRALIVDSHITSSNILASHLRMLGLGQVVRCARAQEAIRHIGDNGFDIVLCEQRLADGTLGQDLIEELRRSGRLSLRTIVMVISADASYNTVAEMAESAVDGFVIRPYSPGGLEDRLIAAYRRKEALGPVFDAIEANRHADALAICETLYSRRGPYWTYAARLGAELALRLNRAAQASTLFETVLSVKAVPWAKLGLARTLAAAGAAGQALSTVENLLAAEPRYADAYDVLGKLHAEQGDLQAALKAYRQASQITPASVQRAQKYGILAFYAGQGEMAQIALERAASLGVQSRHFDPQTLMLLAMLHYRQGQAEALQGCRVKLATVLAETGLVDSDADSDADGGGDGGGDGDEGRRSRGLGGGGSGPAQRLQRFGRTAEALVLTLQGEHESAATLALGLAAEGTQPDFDIEAATNLLSLLAELRAAHVPLADDATWVQRLGLRFCVSRHATEVLVQACQAHQAYATALRQAHAEIGEMAQAALGQVLAGEPQSAVEQLLLQSESTCNAKLLHTAAATLWRYRERIAATTQLQARCEALQAYWGHAVDADPARHAGRTVHPGNAMDAMDAMNAAEADHADPPGQHPPAAAIAAKAPAEPA